MSGGEYNHVIWHLIRAQTLKEGINKRITNEMISFPRSLPRVPQYEVIYPPLNPDARSSSHAFSFSCS